jgi:16S rRNA processing protein RimM
MTKPAKFNRSQPGYLLLGKVLRPHGVRGELRVSTLTDFPERIDSLENVYLGNSPEDTTPKPYPVESVRLHQDYILLKFKNVPDRNAAELLRDLYVMIDIANAAPLDEDEFYLYELIGMMVQTEDGRKLGEIVDVLETGANDVYIIESDKYGEILFPAHAETLIEFNFDDGVVIVKPPEGLLPD